MAPPDPADRGVRQPGLWLWAAGWLAVSLAMLVPAPVAGPSGSDLVVHFVVFGALAAWPVTFCRRPRALAGFGVLTAAVAAALEVMQGLLPYRSFDPADISANLLGTAVGVATALLMRRALHRRATQGGGADI